MILDSIISVLPLDMSYGYNILTDFYTTMNAQPLSVKCQISNFSFKKILILWYTWHGFINQFSKKLMLFIKYTMYNLSKCP